MTMIEFLSVLNTIGVGLCLIVLLMVYLRAAQSDSAGLREKLEGGLETQNRSIEKLERAFREEVARGRTEAQAQARDGRNELQEAMHKMTEASASRLTQLSILTQQQLETVRKTVEDRLLALQNENGKKLEEMRATVDEKLQSTLEKRLTESFRLVSERLEMVQRGLGEMQSLAVGVGDLKRVLANVKTRGNWGEMQLAMLLEQTLAPDQYEKDKRVKQGSDDHVEFVVKIPVREEFMWLPIDSKFPADVYERLLDAQEKADMDLITRASKELEAFVKKAARDIADKYIDPPATTDYAILFLPTEGLYAEVLRIPGLVSKLHSEHRVSVAGPTTLSALLNAFQMGFRTLAIQKRSSEVWKLLEQVQTDFSRFGTILDRTQKKLQEASNNIDSARTTATRIQKRLGQAGQLQDATVNGEEESQEMLGLN